MRLTLEAEEGKYTAEVPSDSPNLQTLVDDLIRPVLRAVGYMNETIDEVLGPER